MRIPSMYNILSKVLLFIEINTFNTLSLDTKRERNNYSKATSHFTHDNRMLII